MKAMAVAQRITAEEFLAMEDLPRGAQLIEGEIVLSAPRPRHQQMLLDLAMHLRTWTDAGSARGTVSLSLDVKLDEHNVFAPDLLWYGPRSTPPEPDALPSPLPDLAVEVRSPSTWRYDIGAKKTAYERQGLPELWLVDTAAAEILIFRRSARAATTFDSSEQLARGQTLTSRLLPGFALALGELFGED